MATKAEIRKRFTQKVGYENALDFDPVNGIVKFGSYEAFIKDLGIKPQRQEYNYQDYVKSLSSNWMLYGTRSLGSEKDLRAQFERAVMNNTMPQARNAGGPFAFNNFTGISSQNQSGLFGFSNSQETAPTYRQVSRLSPDSFAVDSYVIPNDQRAGYNLLNEISRRASGLAKSAQASRSNDALRQNQQDAISQRQGRAATVLSGINT